MGEYRYVLQRRYQTELAKKVGDALGDILDHIEKGSLHILEDGFELTSPKPIPEEERRELCGYLLKRAKEDGDTTTLSFEFLTAPPGLACIYCILKSLPIIREYFWISGPIFLAVSVLLSTIESKYPSLESRRV